jgi:hypothetical protein
MPTDGQAISIEEWRSVSVEQVNQIADLIFDLRNILAGERIEHPERPHYHPEVTDEAITRLYRSVDIHHPAIMDDPCSICLEAYYQASKIHAPAQLLACGHIFGGECLKEWLSQNSTCPSCRRDATKQYADSWQRRCLARLQGTEFFKTEMPARTQAEISNQVEIFKRIMYEVDEVYEGDEGEVHSRSDIHIWMHLDMMLECGRSKSELEQRAWREFRVIFYHEVCKGENDIDSCRRQWELPGYHL